MGLGGAERVVVSLAEGLVARGHEVAVSGAPGPLDAELPGIARLVLPERGRNPLGAGEWVAREAAFIRRYRPHVIHAHNAKATAIAALAARVARGPRRPPLLATHHGAAQDDRAGAARLISRAADQVVVVSADLHATFPGALVINNGIPLAGGANARGGEDARGDERRGGENPHGGDDARGEGRGTKPFGADGRPLVLFLGRLEPVKNPQRFIDVAERVPEAQFIVVGDGSLRHALRGPVTFTGARDDARALLAQADLLLVTSDSEGQSIAVLEALAAGTPVVSTPVPGMAELDGVTVATFDPEDLARATRELLHDPVRRHRLGRAGARLVRERFSADYMVTAYERAYHALTIGTQCSSTSSSPS